MLINPETGYALISLKSDSKGVLRNDDVIELRIVKDDAEVLNISMPIQHMAIGDKFVDSIDLAKQDLDHFGFSIQLGDYAFMLPAGCFCFHERETLNGETINNITYVNYSIANWGLVIPALLVEDGTSQEVINVMQEQIAPVPTEIIADAHMNIFCQAIETGIDDGTIDWSA